MYRSLTALNLGVDIKPGSAISSEIEPYEIVIFTKNR